TQLPAALSKDNSTDAKSASPTQADSIASSANSNQGQNRMTEATISKKTTAAVAKTPADSADELKSKTGPSTFRHGKNDRHVKTMHKYSSIVRVLGQGGFGLGAASVSGFRVSLHRSRCGVLYRDLKPENLMLDRFGYLQLADLGFAKLLDPSRGWVARRLDQAPYAEHAFFQDVDFVRVFHKQLPAPHKPTSKDDKRFYTGRPVPKNVIRISKTMRYNTMFAEF
uniref:Protein kinase domain-containing protein n=1 Tax=Macrostomum lignano TaxID=282301 RepID=A0A1I8FD18_9PLAT